MIVLSDREPVGGFWEMAGELEATNGLIAMVSERTVLNRLQAVEDPAIGVDIVTLGLVTEVVVDDGEAAVSVAFDAPRSPAEWTMCDEIRAVCRGLGLVPRIYADPVGDRPSVSGVRNVLAIAGDDPAVGASLLTANLATALASIGARVGVLAFGRDTEQDGERSGDQRDSRGSWLDDVDRLQVSDESIHPGIERGVAVAQLGPVCAAITDAAGDELLELIVPTVVDALEWGQLDYLLVRLPRGPDRPTPTILEAVAPTGTVVVGSAERAPSETSALLREFRALGPPVLAGVGTVTTTGDVAEGWRGYELEPGTPALGPVPLDRCTLTTDAETDPETADRAVEEGPYRELALSIADRLGETKRRSVVERSLA